MASNRLKELMDQVESSSDSYAHLSTQLSDEIVAFEDQLNLLKGKVAVSIRIEGSNMLIFCRSGDRWRLELRRDFGSSKDSWPLTAASVPDKARAVCRFAELLGRMIDAHKSQRKEVEKALDSLSKLSASTRKTTKRGK